MYTCIYIYIYIFTPMKQPTYISCVPLAAGRIRSPRARKTCPACVATPRARNLLLLLSLLLS